VFDDPRIIDAVNELLESVICFFVSVINVVLDLSPFYDGLLQLVDIQDLCLSELGIVGLDDVPLITQLLLEMERY